jgi:alpha-galactosidase
MKLHKLTRAVLFFLLLNNSSVFAKNGSDWTDITVDVKANYPVTATQKTEKQKDGFTRLKIVLANDGKQPLTIEQITIRIPIIENTSNETEALFGGSDMWRNTVINRKLGQLDKKCTSNLYAMLKLTEGDYLFAGSLTWRIFLPYITINNGAYLITSNGENKQLLPGEKIDYEQIVLSQNTNWVNQLGQFGEAIAKENKIGKLKDVTYNGWATWDYYGRVFTADDVNKNMDQLKKLPLETNLVQVDGGWWPERGDYMLVHNKIPGGIKAIGARVRAEGKKLGLHFDGFRGDAKSEICKTHPEYFLHDQDGKLFVKTQETPDHKLEHTFFDYSHPGAREYIASCIKNMKENWGVSYFKIDFMCNGLDDFIKGNNKSISFKAYNPGITSVERYRLGMQTMREAIGTDGYFLGCTAVFGPTIGFVDAMRTGNDINPVYESFGERALSNSSNFYLKSVFNLDPDYMVARAAADEDASVSIEDRKSGGTLTENEAKMWIDFVSMYGNIRLNSDNLTTLRPERKAIIIAGLKAPKKDETVPLDLWQHATEKNDAIELLLSRSGKEIYLGIFNWGDNAKEYYLPEFGKSARKVQLEGRHSVIINYEGKDTFAYLCQKLKRN